MTRLENLPQGQPIDLLVRGAQFATMAQASGYGEILGGALLAHQGKILWVGPEKEMPTGFEARQDVDVEGAWVTPGLIDCHTHLVWAGSRAEEIEQRLCGVSYQDIARAGGGIISTVRATRDASLDALVAAAEERLDQFQEEGVTTIEIKSGYGLDTDNELKMLEVARHLGKHRQIRVQKTFLGAHALPPEFAGRSSDYIDYLCHEMLPEAHRRGLVDAVDAFCEGIAFSPTEVRRVFDCAKGLGLPVKLHADQLSDLGGAALVAEYGGLSADHVEYTSEASVAAMAKAGTVAVLLPGAFYNLREQQKPPVAAFRRYGVPMAVSTDCNPGTSPCSSLLLMLHMACVFFGLTPAEALAGVTCNAAKALGLQNEVGRIVPGLSPELLVWDIDHPRDLAYYLGRNPLDFKLMPPFKG